MKTLFGMILSFTVLTSGIQAHAANCSAANSLVSVKNYKSGSLEYVEFKIKTPASFTKTTTAVTGPFTFDPSDNPVPVNGALFTKIQFVSLDWMCTTPKMIASKPIVKDVQLVENFEGYVSYVIGRKALTHYLGTTNTPCGGYRCVRVKFGP